MKTATLDVGGMLSLLDYQAVENQLGSIPGVQRATASVATSGIIGWVGLVVPHLARALVGPDFPRLIPISPLH